MTPTPRDEVTQYQSYELADMEGRAVLNIPAPGISVVLVSDHDAAIQQAVAAQRERDASIADLYGAIAITPRGIKCSVGDLIRNCKEEA